MDTAVEEGLLAEQEIFPRNRPVVIVPAGIEEFRDLADASARIVLAEDGVPTAEYTEAYWPMPAPSAPGTSSSGSWIR